MRLDPTTSGIRGGAFTSIAWGMKPPTADRIALSLASMQAGEPSVSKQ